MTRTDFSATSSGANRVNVIISAGRARMRTAADATNRPPAVAQGLPIDVIGNQRATQKQAKRNGADRQQMECRRH